MSAPSLNCICVLQVAMIGHSAGAHLCAMALLQRLPSVRHMLPSSDASAWQDARMPAQFIGKPPVECMATESSWCHSADESLEARGHPVLLLL